MALMPIHLRGEQTLQSTAGMKTLINKNIPLPTEILEVLLAAAFAIPKDGFIVNLNNPDGTFAAAVRSFTTISRAAYAESARQLYSDRTFAFTTPDFAECEPKQPPTCLSHVNKLHLRVVVLWPNRNNSRRERAIEMQNVYCSELCAILSNNRRLTDLSLTFVFKEPEQLPIYLQMHSYLSPLDLAAIDFCKGQKLHVRNLKLFFSYDFISSLAFPQHSSHKETVWAFDAESDFSDTQYVSQEQSFRYSHCREASRALRERILISNEEILMEENSNLVKQTEWYRFHSASDFSKGYFECWALGRLSREHKTAELIATFRENRRSMAYGNPLVRAPKMECKAIEPESTINDNIDSSSESGEDQAFHVGDDSIVVWSAVQSNEYSLEEDHDDDIEHDPDNLAHDGDGHYAEDDDEDLQRGGPFGVHRTVLAVDEDFYDFDGDERITRRYLSLSQAFP